MAAKKKNKPKEMERAQADPPPEGPDAKRRTPAEAVEEANRRIRESGDAQ